MHFLGRLFGISERIHTYRVYLFSFFLSSFRTCGLFHYWTGVCVVISLFFIYIYIATHY